MDQTQNYKQMVEKHGISKSTVRSHVFDLKNKGAFNDLHFDKTIHKTQISQIRIKKRNKKYRFSKKGCV